MHTPTHRPRYRQSPIHHLTPPPATALSAVAEGEVTPEQVWQGLPPLLQAATRRTALRILREVTDDVC